MNPSGGNQPPFFINESSTPPPSNHTPSKPFFINQPEQGSGNKPFYISQTASPRRTWGEPAPIKLPPAVEYPAPQFQPPQPYSHMQPPTQQPYGAPPPGYNQPYPYPPQPYCDQYGRPVGVPYPGGAYPSFAPGYTQPYQPYPTYHQPPYTPPDVHHPPQVIYYQFGDGNTYVMYCWHFFCFILSFVDITTAFQLMRVLSLIARKTYKLLICCSVPAKDTQWLVEF